MAITETVIAVRSPFEALWLSFVEFFPKLIGLIFLLFLGYLTGLVLGHILKVILQKAGLDRYVDKSELSKAIGKTHLSSILGEILKWWVFIIFLQAAVDSIKLGAISRFLDGVVSWLPNLIIAIVVVLIVLTFAHWLELKIRQHSNMQGIRTFASILKWVIVVIGALIAFRQIGIQVGLLEDVIRILLAAFGIGIALALGIGLGLGLKKDAEKFIRSFMNNF